MIINEQQSKEMLEAAKPLMKWLNDNCHPHCELTVTQTAVELKEGIAGNITDEYVRD